MTSLLLILTLFGHPPNNTVDSTPLRSKIYLVDIYKYESGASKGYLRGITDSSLQLTTMERPYGYSSFDATLQYDAIEHVSVHRKGAIRGALLLGILLGGAVGAIVGLAAYKSCINCVIDSGAGLNMLKGVTVGLPIGAAIGYLIGRRRHAFDISRNLGNFQKMRSKLLRSYGDKSQKAR